ncbi:hypothetical protein V6N13_116198 [Hibiscus sabdariffa]|uniref:Uncharacterized protein n=2 Tax=Hibiscus sabdariffa TaxID=183260 RepID=A0ABR2PCN3_9ROSI
MRILESKLKLASHVHGFSNQPIAVKGNIHLLVIMGDDDKNVTQMVNFLVIDRMSSYNAIIGRPLMRKAKMIMATYYLYVKFRTPMGEGYTQTDQREARQFHILFLQLAQEHREHVYRGKEVASQMSVSEINVLNKTMMNLESLDIRE